MKLFKRFAYYFGGFSIGIIAVFFIWGGKEASCAYFPNARVLKEIRSKDKEFSPQAEEFFLVNQIDSTDIDQILHQGKVHFGESHIGRNVVCRVYVISGNLQEENKLQIEVELCEETFHLATILKAEFIEEL